MYISFVSDFLVIFFPKSPTQFVFTWPLSTYLRWWQLPYFWAGIKMYDLISGGQILKASYYLSKPQVLERFPLLKQDKLVGGLVYYDGK